MNAPMLFSGMQETDRSLVDAGPFRLIRTPDTIPDRTDRTAPVFGEKGPKPSESGP